MKRRINNTIKVCDILVILTIIFLIGTRICTLLYISNISEFSGTQIENVVKLYEANPLAKLFLNLNGIRAILSSLILPAWGFALYIYIRNKVKKGLVEPDTLQFYVLFAFCIFFLNIINDLSMLLGRII